MSIFAWFSLLVFLGNNFLWFFCWFSAVFGGLVVEYVIRYGFQVGTFVVRVPKKFVSSFPKNEWERIRKEWKIDQDKAKVFFSSEAKKPFRWNMEQSIMNYCAKHCHLVAMSQISGLLIKFTIQPKHTHSFRLDSCLHFYELEWIIVGLDNFCAKKWRF